MNVPKIPKLIPHRDSNAQPTASRPQARHERRCMRSPALASARADTTNGSFMELRVFMPKYHCSKRWVFYFFFRFSARRLDFRDICTANFMARALSSASTRAFGIGGASKIPRYKSVSRSIKGLSPANADITAA